MNGITDGDRRTVDTRPRRHHEIFRAGHMCSAAHCGRQPMILPTWSATRMDNTQNLWKRASNLRKRFTSYRRCLFPAIEQEISKRASGNFFEEQGISIV